MTPFSQDALQLAPAFDEQEKQFAHAFAIIRQAIEQRAFPGASLAVTHRGALVASQGFGRFTYRQSSPAVRAETIFDLASLTKVVATTATAMLLYQRAKLSLDQPVEKILPEFITLAPKHQHTAAALRDHSNAAGALQRTARLRKAFSDCQDARGCGARGDYVTTHRRSRNPRRIQRHRLHCAGRGLGPNRWRSARCLRAARDLRSLGNDADLLQSSGGMEAGDSTDRRRRRHSLVA